MENKDEKRYRYYDIKSSFLKQLNNTLSTSFDDKYELEKALSYASEILNDKQLVIIIDGLDHVWRDIGKKDDLDILFNNLFPLPNNIKLIIGTQPVDSEKLPHKLLEFERDKWLSLPFMSIKAIKNYLMNDKRIFVPKDYHSDYYNDISEAFHKLTNGHPLHLIYSLEFALNNHSRLWPFDIERLPACPQNDIREYYRGLLSKIDEYSKLALYIYVVSEIDIWKKNDLEECLVHNGISNASKYYNKIRHLLVYNGYFIKAFHESIFAYIKEELSNEDQIKCLKYIKKWIAKQNEDIYIDLYLPIINSRLGDYSDIHKISRIQINDYFKKGYSLGLISKFLSKAEQITFFKLKDFIKTTELRHLKTRINSLLKFNTYRAELFCYLHFNLYKNQSVINYMQYNINNLDASELVVLSDFCQNRDTKIKEILRQMELQYKKVASSRELQNNNALHVLANCSNITHVYQKCIDMHYYEGLTYLFNHLCTLKRTGHIKEFTSKNITNYAIIRRLCLYAIEQKIDLTSWVLPKQYLENSYLATMLYLNKGCIQTNVKSLENSIVQKRKNEDYEYSGRCLDLENYFHSLFFENLYNKLVNSKTGSSVETYNGFENFVNLLSITSAQVAEMIKKSQEIDLNYLLALFENFSEDNILHEVRWNSKYRIAKSSITRIIIDLLILLNICNKKLDENDISALINFRHFHEYNWLEDYFDKNIIYLTENAVKVYLKKEQDILNKSLQYTQERTDQYLLLANFARMHNLIDDAKLYFDKVFCMIIGYGYHKDPSLFEVLEIIEYCMDVEHIDFTDILRRMAKIVDNIEYITDEGFNYAKRILMRLFCKYSKEYAVQYYNYLLDTEQWYVAEECLNEIFENIDENDTNIDLLLSTVTSDTPFRKLSPSSVVVQKHKNLVGRKALVKKDKYSSNADLLDKQNVVFNYAEYPPEKLAKFIE